MIRSIFATFCLILLVAPSVALAEEAAPVPPVEAEVEQISPEMKSLNGILAKRRSDSEKGKKSLSLLDDIEQPERPPIAGRMFQGLALCLGVFFIGSWVARRFGPQAGQTANRQIKIIEKAALGPKTGVCLIEVDGRRVLLSTGAEPAQVLMSSDEAVSGPKSLEGIEGFEESLEVICADKIKLSA